MSAAYSAYRDRGITAIAARETKDGEWKKYLDRRSMFLNSAVKLAGWAMLAGIVVSSGPAAPLFAYALPVAAHLLGSMAKGNAIEMAKSSAYKYGEPSEQGNFLKETAKQLVKPW